MFVKQGIKSLLKNPFAFGASIGILVILFNISIASIAEGSLEKGYQVFLTNGIFVYLIPLAVGIQMGLFRHHGKTYRKTVDGPLILAQADPARIRAKCPHFDEFITDLEQTLEGG